MYSYRLLATCCLLLLFTFNSFGQPSLPPSPKPSLPRTLLWRISGKGLEKPSYLYGTLHLNDKRLFNFTDSVYRAIEKCDGLAIEVNPDEMAAYYVNQLVDQLSDGKKLKDVLDERYFDKHRAALSKKFNKRADDISTSDIIREKNRWMSDYMRKGEMPTFMDAWLFNVARRQGKWLGGIEDLTDQTGLFGDLVDRSDVDDVIASDNGGKDAAARGGVERMISLYSGQDVDGIKNFTDDNSTPEQEDKILIRRNVKMARRIDSLSHVRTMFLAIGAAHLAGDSGVISLLRKRGLTVEPVFSIKKIAASDYTFKEVHIPWVAVSDSKGYYEAEMPANPASVKLFGLVEMRFLLDLFNMSGYCTMAVVNSNRSANLDSLFDGLARGMMHGSKAKAVRKLELNGVPGREYLYSGDDGNLRVQVFADERMLYMAMVSSMKKDLLLSADADKFFGSFRIRRQVPASADVVKSFTDSVMGISFLSPTELERNEKMSTSSDSWKVSCYTGADEATGAYVMLFSRDIRAGHYIDADSIIQNDFAARIKTQYDHLDQRVVVVDGAQGLRLSGSNIKNPKLSATCLSLMKDGRNIVVMIISDSAKQSDNRLLGVFSSLHFLSRPPVAGRTDGPPDGKWVCTVPAPMRPMATDAGKTIQWLSYDTTTAESYHVMSDTIGKYAWYPSDSVFWSRKIEGFRRDGKYEVAVKDIAIGGRAGKELFIRSKGNLYSRRIRLILDGDVLYELFVSGENHFLRSGVVDTFFMSFHLKTPPSANSVTESKTALLLRDLASTDSVVRREASLALYNAPFERKDGPLLREALFRRYRAPYFGDTAVSTTVNEQLAAHIAKLGDSASVAYVHAVYGSLTGEKEMYRNVALQLLAKQQTEYSYSVLGDLLSRGPVTEQIDFMTLLALRDSLSLTAKIFPAFRSWAGDTLQASSVAYVADELLDSGYLHQEVIEGWAPAFIGAANALLPAAKNMENLPEKYLSSLLRLIGQWHSQEAYAALHGWLRVKDKGVAMEAAVQLAAAGQPVPIEVLQRLAADPAYRVTLYDRLKEKKKTFLFPVQYSTQEHFAQAQIYLSARDDEDEDEPEEEKVDFLLKKTASFAGKRYTWYLYKVSFTSGDQTTVHLGVAGGYSVGGTALKPEKDLTGVYWREDFDEKDLSSQLNAFLEKQKETEERNEAEKRKEAGEQKKLE